jgi:hypothetical protein
VSKTFIKNVLVGWKKGLFEHKCVLAFISLTFVHAKWTKSRPTFVQTFNWVWQHWTKVFYNKTCSFYEILYCFVSLMAKIFCSAQILQIPTPHPLNLAIFTCYAVSCTRKMFIKWPPERIIKPFSLSLTSGQNKLACLSLACILDIAQYLKKGIECEGTICEDSDTMKM